jgi:hypothetical protein
MQINGKIWFGRISVNVMSIVIENPRVRLAISLLAGLVLADYSFLRHWHPESIHRVVLALFETTPTFKELARACTYGSDVCPLSLVKPWSLIALPDVSLWPDMGQQ